MSALGRLKVRIAEQAPASSVSFGSAPGTHISETLDEASVGFVGGSSTRVFEQEGPKWAFVSSDGDRGRGVSAFEASSISETPLPHYPTEPPEAGGSVLENPLPTSPTKPTYRDEPQTDLSRCWVCTRVETPGDAFVAICSDALGEHFWMHGGCWSEHVRRVAEARKVGTCTFDSVKHTHGGGHAP